MVYKFNSRSRTALVKSIARIEKRALLASLLGASELDPVLCAIFGVVVFLVCEAALVFLAGWVDPDAPPRRRSRTTKASDTEDDDADR